MYTLSNGTESPDSKRLAFGQQVEDLLSQSNPEEWINDLWSIYSGYMSFEQEAGYNPRCSEVFETFKGLVLFFHEIEKLK